MIWGEVSSWLTKRQDHRLEIERLKLQGQLDAEQHGRNLDAIRVQAQLGVETIRVQASADVDRFEAEGWLEAVKATGRQTGIRFVDAWNAGIRPAVATWSVGMMTLAEFGAIAMSDNTTQVAGAALGLYLADRTLAKRGK
jgi:hypothetical protein